MSFVKISNSLVIGPWTWQANMLCAMFHKPCYLNHVTKSKPKSIRKPMRPFSLTIKGTLPFICKVCLCVYCVCFLIKVLFIFTSIYLRLTPHLSHHKSPSLLHLVLILLIKLSSLCSYKWYQSPNNDLGVFLSSFC